MFKRVRPYMGEYIKYTWAAVACCTAAIVLSVLPYFFIYRLILPLIEGRELGASVAAVWIGLSALCMALHGLLYVKGLEFSHICAFNTLKNLRFALQAKVEAQPLGAIREIGGGRLKQVFTDDIEMIELLLAHGSHPEQEVDKVTTPGGITIKGLNAMEEAGFTNAVIKGLKAGK